MRFNLQLFTEKVGADGETQTVRRAPELEDDTLLPGEHARRVGDKILQYVLEVNTCEPRIEWVLECRDNRGLLCALRSDYA